MSSEERRAHRDGTVWQLYEWQQRQQFRHGSPTAPICAGSLEFSDQGRSRSMLEVPRSISVPPSPSDIPPPGPPRVFPPRRPHTPAERVTVKPPDQRRSVDISLGASPKKARGHTIKVRLEHLCLVPGIWPLGVRNLTWFEYRFELLELIMIANSYAVLLEASAILEVLF